MAVLAPVQRAEATSAERRAAAEVALRGMCLAPLWSPFWIAMAVVYQYLPNVPLWQVLATGIPLAIVGLVLAETMYTRSLNLNLLWIAVKGLAPVGPPVAICAIAIVLVTSLTNLSTIQAVVVATPVMCAIALISISSNAVISSIGSVYRGLGSMTDEIVLVTVSIMLGRVLEWALTEAGVTAWIGSLALPPESLIPIVILVTAATSLVGIHQLVSITLLLVLLAPFTQGLLDVLLMQAALLGWAMASMVGITAVSLASAAAMFKVPMGELSFGANLRFAAVYSVLATIILIAANRLIAA